MLKTINYVIKNHVAQFNRFIEPHGHMFHNRSYVLFTRNTKVPINTGSLLRCIYRQSRQGLCAKHTKIACQKYSINSVNNISTRMKVWHGNCLGRELEEDEKQTDRVLSLYSLSQKTRQILHFLRSWATS